MCYTPLFLFRFFPHFSTSFLLVCYSLFSPLSFLLLIFHHEQLSDAPACPPARRDKPARLRPRTAPRRAPDVCRRPQAAARGRAAAPPQLCVVFGSDFEHLSLIPPLLSPGLGIAAGAVGAVAAAVGGGYLWNSVQHKWMQQRTAATCNCTETKRHLLSPPLLTLRLAPCRYNSARKQPQARSEGVHCTAGNGQLCGQYVRR